MLRTILSPYHRLPETPMTFPPSSVASQYTEMPPPSSITVPRRVPQFDHMLIHRPASRRQQPSNRPFTTVQAAGDYRPGKDDDEDDQAYDTANDDNDI